MTNRTGRHSVKVLEVGGGGPAPLAGLVGLASGQRELGRKAKESNIQHHYVTISKVWN
jgi:hypothetical protein